MAGIKTQALKDALDVVLNKEYLEDFVYEVRNRAWEDPQPEWDEWVKDPANKNASKWDHPRIKRFTDAVKVLEDAYENL